MKSVDEMRERFGDEETDKYIRLAKALRALMATWEGFTFAPEGSVMEDLFRDQFEGMMQDIADHPDHAGPLIEGLVALVLHLKHGGSYEEWFETLGIAAYPGQ